ncbi:MAG TPA: MarR family transcriptional regulator [Steroidobacteraceae bacterium]
MKLTPIMQRYVVHWGEMGTRWGLNRSVAQMHALLYLSAEPLHADEVAETLGIARSNVSVGLKELLSWNLVQVTQTLGDRRDFFVAQRDPWEVVRIIVEGRKRRELDPTISFLKECAAELALDRDTPAYTKDQIAGQLEFMETLMGWYESIRSLPRKTLLKMMRMGQRIAKIIGD